MALKILVIEDEPRMFNLIQFRLQAEGFEAILSICSTFFLDLHPVTINKIKKQDAIIFK